MNKLLLLALLSVPSSALAVPLPWSTTFDCEDWLSPSQPLNCDGLALKGSWSCEGQYAEIVAAGNYASGGGGKGQRIYKGDGDDENSNSTRIFLDERQPEMWIRWYMRYPLGFSWSYLLYDKWLYIDQGLPNFVVPEWYGDAANIGVSGFGNVQAPDKGWPYVMGGPTGDGEWHLYEVHLKMDTNGNDGVAELWIDEEQVINRSDVDFGTHAGWSTVMFGSNQNSPNNGVCLPIDFDDIVVTNTGYIGPIEGTTTSPPTAPQGLRVRE